MKLRRVISLILCFVIAMSFAVPTYAVEGELPPPSPPPQVDPPVVTAKMEITVDGVTGAKIEANQEAQVINISEANEFVSYEIGITGGATTMFFNAKDHPTHAGTVGEATISISITNHVLTWTVSGAPNDCNLFIKVISQPKVVVPVSFTMDAGSNGASIGNVSDQTTPTCNYEHTGTTVLEDGTYTVTFTPKEKNTITKLNIRTGAAETVNLYDAVSQVFLYGGASYAVTKNENGTVSISIDHVKANTFITALTVTESKYTLTVTSDGYCTSSVNTAELSSLTGTDFVLTPKAGSFISAVQITDGSGKNSLTQNKSTMQISGKTYTAVWNPDNSVTVSVPAANANVQVFASTSKTVNTYTVQCVRMTGFSSNCSSPVTHNNLEKAEIVLVPSADYAISSLTISCGSETKTISVENGNFTLGGQTHTIYTDSRGSVSVKMTPGIGNIYVTDVNIRSTKCVVRVDTDRRVTSNQDSVAVSQGRNAQFTFTPDKDYHIIRITVQRYGKTYYANPEEDKFIEVNGVRSPISRDSYGRVSLSLNQIDANMVVSVYTDFTGIIYDYTVSITTATGVSASNSKLKVSSNKDASITFTPQSNYRIDRIDITKNGRLYTADPREENYITVDGTRCQLSIDSNGRVTLELRKITADTAVHASAKYIESGFIADADRYTTITTNRTPTQGKDVTVTITPDSGRVISSVVIDDGTTSKRITENTYSFSMNSNYYSVSKQSSGVWTINFTMPKSLTMTSMTARKSGVSEIHAAYINGYGNDIFKPEATITRSEVVTMLARQYSGLTLNQLNAFAGSDPYVDVAATYWGAPYIGWAYGKGYLKCLSVSSRKEFFPVKEITRAEFVSLIYAFEGNPTAPVPSRFPDVRAGYWAKTAIDYATGHDWIFGYPDGTFKPENRISRAEVVAIVNRVFDRDYVHEVVDIATVKTFKDVPSGHWAYWDILEASSAHTMTGTKAK